LLRFNSVIGFQSDFIYHDNWIARVQIEKETVGKHFIIPLLWSFRVQRQ